MLHIDSCSIIFFFNDTATTEIYTLSLHDALPILSLLSIALVLWLIVRWDDQPAGEAHDHHLLMIVFLLALTSTDRKSTRLNSSHGYISYAVFCLKKKKKD